MQVSQLNGNQIVMGGEALLDTYYRVGRIYQSTENVSPAAFMGGSWERIQDVFLLCAGSIYAAGSTGGEANVTLTVEQIPSHSHIRDIENNILTPNPPATGTGAWSPCTLNLGNVTNDNHQVETRNTGGGQAHNNIPPYLAVYCWRRVA